MNLSVLNLTPLRQGESYKDAYDSMVRLAQEVERLGYKRCWIAEHHNTKSFGSSATALLIELVAANTSMIRVGSGGVMLPNHSPYVVAEQFGTLEELFPGRIDLGLGRAPGTDRVTAAAIRRTSDLQTHFEEKYNELEGYFANTQKVHAYPAAGLKVPVYILGSSLKSAEFAAKHGLPYSFASHFAPKKMEEAVALYRDTYVPSEEWPEPYVMLGVNAFAAETDEEADRIQSTSLLMTIGILEGSRKGLQPPLESCKEAWQAATSAPSSAPHFGPVKFNVSSINSNYRKAVEDASGIVLAGNPASLAKSYRALQERVHFDELIVNSFIYYEEDQVNSFKILADTIGNL